MSVRCVFDTNALISAALFPNSLPGRALRHALGRGRILLSNDVVAELVEVLARTKFDRYLTSEERSTFVQALVAEAELIEISQRIVACRDPKDDKVLELALNGAATHLITGDDDLLVLNPFQGIPIVAPGTFLLEVDPRSSSGPGTA